MEQQQLRFEDLSWWNRRQQMSFEENAVALKQATEQVSNEEFGSFFMPVKQLSDEFFEALMKRLFKDHTSVAELVAIIKPLYLDVIESMKKMPKERSGKFFKKIIKQIPKEYLVAGMELALEYDY